MNLFIQLFSLFLFIYLRFSSRYIMSGENILCSYFQRQWRTLNKKILRFFIQFICSYYKMKKEDSKQKTDIKQKKNIKTEGDEPSYWQMMIDGIVRPPRAKYNMAQLGSKYVEIKNRAYIKQDYSVNHGDKNLDLTVYKCVVQKPYPIPFVLLYMHGNSSCRVEALGLMKNIPEGICLASFDFMGCGKNDQFETISLGYREAEQADTITKYLKGQGYRVIIWGRSMGAATALLYGKSEFIVADSSFKSFKSLCKQVAKEHSPAVVPNFMINCFFPCVFSKLKKDVDKRAKYDVEDLDVKEAVKRLDPQTTVIFMSGENDQLINKRNSQKLYMNCPCKHKYLKIFEGDHNSKRPESILNEVMDIIHNYVKGKQPVSSISANEMFQKMQQ